jgi:hypothetical protein
VKEFDMSFLMKTHRTHVLLASVALALATWSARLVQAVEPNDDILGTWKLIKVLDSSEISALDDKEAGKLIGKMLVIRPDKVTLAGESCDDPEFERHYEDTAKYLREEAHAAAGRLGLPEVVTVVDLACTEALMKGYNKIVVYWKGFFFEAVKQQPGDSIAQK